MNKTNNYEGLDRDNPDDLLRLRAQARAVLEDRSRLQYVVIEFVSCAPRADGEPPMLAAGDLPLPPAKALIQIPGALTPDREYARLADESRDEFVRRLAGILPAIGPPALIILFAPEDDQLPALPSEIQ